ncbi:protein-tyrosine phosphatase [Microbacterium resistens]|uniref:Protein-tyrosine phosphatase n=1 Tax=Microbacterium resistens TaxID=156977 RepID=A0ABU1S8F7_9MICO|nr:tyrosine-protein phosphatase [Microbacterium resistens]MDR6865895.1 protein-tyrosine phosphatase [Microbacterium resistens]
MSDLQDRKISIPSAPNLRDLGGLPATVGRIRQGVLYRSATLASLTDADGPRFAALGVETVYDLRTAGEVAASPDRLPEGIRGVGLDVLADSSLSVAARLDDLSANPQAFAESLGDGKAERLFEETYRDIVRLPSALAAYRALLLGLLDESRTGAALFHCTTGKDRTGWAAASILTLLGVDEGSVYQDYLQTNTDLLPALEPVLRHAESLGVDRETLMPVLGVRESYLRAAFAQVREQFGTIAGYAADGLGLTASDIDGLRRLLT